MTLDPNRRSTPSVVRKSQSTIAEAFISEAVSRMSGSTNEPMWSPIS